MHNINKISPRTEPCGTPYNSGVYKEEWLTKASEKVLLEVALRYPHAMWVCLILGTMVHSVKRFSELYQKESSLLNTEGIISQKTASQSANRWTADRCASVPCLSAVWIMCLYKWLLNRVLSSEAAMLMAPWVCVTCGWLMAKTNHLFNSS